MSLIRWFKKWLPAGDEVHSKGGFVRQATSMIRREYRGEPFDEDTLKEDPVDQFELWFSEAVARVQEDPNAMALSTVDERNRPVTRMVLLKGFDRNGFIFYTNYNSRKSQNLESNPHAALTFYWPELVRQIRIEGSVERVPEKQSDEYFQSRPLASRLSAWASPQSKEVGSRAELEKRLKEMEEKFADGEVPRPEFWGGYRVIPDRFEFWQGRINRLHDRFGYTLQDDGSWRVSRLAP